MTTLAKRAVKRTSTSKRRVVKKSGKTQVAGTTRPASKAVSRKPAKAQLPQAPVWQWSAVETAAAIRSGAVSSVEVTEAHVARMRAVNPKLNAVVVDLSDEALKGAKAADQARARGRELGLLHGVPI